MTPTELKQAREALGMTQDQLAGALGVDRSTVARWEGGANIPRIVAVALRGIRPEDIPLTPRQAVKGT